MKKEKLRHYANVLSAHADAFWVTPLFFALFLIDSVILIIPVDSLLGATVSLRPKHLKKWFLFSGLGFGIGLALVALLVNSHLQPWIFEQFNHWGYISHAEEVIAHAQDYGYIELALGVFTVLPSLFGVLIGVLVHLNPWIVWGISFAGKIFKLIVTIWVVFSGSQVVKKWLGFYAKSSI